MHEPVQPKTGALNFTLYRSLSQKFKATLQIHAGGIMHGRLEDHAGRFAHIKDRTCRIRRPRCRRTRISVSQRLRQACTVPTAICVLWCMEELCMEGHAGRFAHGRPCWKSCAWKTMLAESRMEDHAGAWKTMLEDSRMDKLS